MELAQREPIRCCDHIVVDPDLFAGVWRAHWCGHCRVLRCKICAVGHELAHVDATHCDSCGTAFGRPIENVCARWWSEHPIAVDVLDMIDTGGRSRKLIEPTIETAQVVCTVCAMAEMCAPFQDGAPPTPIDGSPVF